MGESTCLLRSFSTPAETSGVAQEANPMRVLGESISFGRFLSESLDWEKWSAFSHNRYVEEAEKHSKPGSVAAKKAYFEAHYKRKAAEKAAALVQEANAQAGGTFDSETREANRTDLAVMAESDAHGIVTANVHYQVAHCADTDTNQYKCDVGQGGLDTSNVEGGDGQSDIDISNAEGAGDVPHTCTNESLNVKSYIIVDNNSNQFDHVEPHKNIGIPGEERMPDPGNVDQEVLPVKGTEVNSCPKLSTKTRAAKLPHSHNERKGAAALLPRSGISKKSVGVSGENQRLTVRSLHLSINLPLGTGETRIAAAAAQSKSGINSVSKSKKSVEGSIEKKQIRGQSRDMSVNLPSAAGETSKTATAAVKPNNAISLESKCTKFVGGSLKKRPTAQSLQMSINLPSGAGEKSKMVSVLEHNRIEKNHSNLPNISKYHPLTSQTSTKASHGSLNQASENPLSQGRRRSGRLLNKSVSGGVTANAKVSSISADCLKSSSTTKSNPRPPTISSPFRFRSEERAVKRKEFLQRIDEIKNKESENVQLQRTPKDKIEHDHKKLWQSSVFKPKLNEDRNGGSHSPSDHIRKLQSPKFGRKVSSGTVQDKNFGKSRKPPIRTNKSKRITERVTSLPNITRENASPNIQH